MTRVRYLLMLRGSPSATASINRDITERFALSRHRAGDHAALWVSRGRTVIDLDGHGAIVGSLYLPGRAGSQADLSPTMRDSVIASHGDHLLRCCWGGYLAIISDVTSGQVSLLRAPMGDLPCYIARDRDIIFAASDVALLVAASGMRVTVDWPAVARHLAASDVRREETCLSGIAELPGGCRLTVDPQAFTVDARWSPWQSAAPDKQIDDPEEAHRRLRDAVDHSVAMIASDHHGVLLKLSGGLDSSIVATALKRAGAQFDCLNLVTRDATGDERSYAEMAARSVGRHLLERDREIGRVSLARSAVSRLPRPTARSFTQASTSAVREVAAETGADVVFDGGGGDNVFCSLQSVRPVIDCLLDDNGRRLFWPTAKSIAALAQVSLWAVLRKTWSTRRRRFGAYPWPIDRRLLSSQAIEQTASATAHTWFNAPDGALPGKAAHVALVTQAQSVAEGFDVEEPLPTFSPLLAQPVVEACLRVPSWLWFDGSLNRAAARAAFADILPAAIANRSSKGSPDGFIAELYESNRPMIRSLLIDGELAASGIIDVAAVRSLLDDPRPVIGHQHLRIMQLVDVETWARAWTQSADTAAG